MLQSYNILEIIFPPKFLYFEPLSIPETGRDADPCRDSQRPSHCRRPLRGQPDPKVTIDVHIGRPLLIGL